MGPGDNLIRARELVPHQVTSVVFEGSREDGHLAAIGGSFGCITITSAIQLMKEGHLFWLIGGGPPVIVRERDGNLVTSDDPEAHNRLHDLPDHKF